MIRRVIMHPCDAERARRVASLLGATVLLAHNHDASTVLVDIEPEHWEKTAEIVRQTIPGWRLRLAYRE